ncbi:MAG TPA: PAS domain S-box protein [Phycisphaerae bacterium]|nr:PAS domain S-box protein [Phycisphaerae bacterium]HNU44505.1 PAS domain S-box protein [Phycisphaerae bacterium]
MYTNGINEVLSRSRDGLFVIGHDRQFAVFSAGCERITGFSAGEVLGQRCGCRDRQECGDSQSQTLVEALCPGLQVFHGDVATCRQRVRIRRRDGQDVLVETRYSPMYDDHGSVACVVGVVRDISGASDVEKELRKGGNGTFITGGLEPLLPEPAVPVGDAGGGADDGDESEGALDRVLASVERREILQALRTAGGQRTLAAKALGISRSRLYRRMEALRIDPREDV